MKILKLLNRKQIKTTFIIFLFILVNVKLLSQVQQPYLFTGFNKNLNSKVKLTDFTNINNTGTESNSNNVLDLQDETRNYSITSSGQTQNVPLFALNFEDNISNPQCLSKEILSYEVISKVKIGEFDYEKGKENSPSVIYDIEFEITLDGYNNNVLVPNTFPTFILKLKSISNEFVVEQQKNIHSKDLNNNLDINRITVGKIKVLSFSGNTNIAQDIYFDFELKLEELYKPDLSIYELYTEWSKGTINNKTTYVDVVNNDDLNSLNDVFVWNNYNLVEIQNNYSIVQCDVHPSLFEVQILRLYNQKNSYSFDSLNCYSVVDWKKATTLFVPPIKNAEERYYLKDYIPTEGSGYYIFRVRPIYNYYTGGANNSLNWGNWNKSISIDLANSDQIAVLNNCFYKDGDIIDINYRGNIDSVINVNDIKLEHTAIYIKINDNLNWQHQRIFTDSDNRLSQYHENIIYYDDNLKPNQTLNRNIENQLVIGSQSIYDEAGRNVINTLPIPINKNNYNTTSVFAGNLLGDPDDNTSLKYRKGLALTNTSLPYQYFASINKIGTDPFSINLNQGRTNDYYDGNHNFQNSTSLIDNLYLVPSAEFKAYQQNVYSEDGLNRLEYSSQPGAKLSLTNPNYAQKNHALEYFYSKATEEELVELFGKEALNNELISKEIIVDSSSNKVSVTYKDFQDKIIATAIKTPSGYNPAVSNEYGVSFGNNFSINEKYNKQINTNFDFILNDKINLPILSDVNFTYLAKIKGLDLNICKNISEYFVYYNTPTGNNVTFNNTILNTLNTKYNIHGFTAEFDTKSKYNRINNSTYGTPPTIFSSYSNNIDVSKPNDINVTANSIVPLTGANRLFSKISIEEKSQFQNIFNKIDDYYDNFYFGIYSKYKINKVLDLIGEYKNYIYKKDLTYDLDDFIDNLTTGNDYKYLETTSLWTKDEENNTLKSNLVHNNANTCIEPIEIEIPECKICDLTKYEVPEETPGSTVRYGVGNKKYDFAKVLLDKLLEKYKSKEIQGTTLANINLFLINNPIFISTYLEQYHNGQKFRLDYWLKNKGLDDIKSTDNGYLNKIEQKEKLLGLFFFQNTLPLNLIVSGEGNLHGKTQNVIKFNFNTYKGFNELIKNILVDYSNPTNNPTGIDYEDKICYTLDKFIETVVETAVTTQSINDNTAQNVNLGSSNVEAEKDYNESFSTAAQAPPTYYLNKQVNTLDLLFDIIGRNLTGFRYSNSLIESPNENFITHAHKYFKKWEPLTEKLLHNSKELNLKQTLPNYNNLSINNKIIGGNGNGNSDALRVFTADDFYFVGVSNLSNCDPLTITDKKWESFYKEYTNSLYSSEQKEAIDDFMSPDNKSKGREISDKDPTLSGLINGFDKLIIAKDFKNRANDLKEFLQKSANIINSTCKNKEDYFSMVLRKYLTANGYHIDNNKFYDTEYNISQAHFDRLLSILVSDCHRYTDVVVNETFVEYVSKTGANPTNLEPYVYFHISSELNTKRLAYQIALIKNKPLKINGLELGLNMSPNKKFKLGANNSENDNCKYIGKYVTAVNDISNYNESITDITNYINTEINSYLSTKTDNQFIRHKFHDRKDLTDLIRNSLNEKLTEYPMLTNLMIGRLTSWVGNNRFLILNNCGDYKFGNNYITELWQIMKSEPWLKYSDYNRADKTKDPNQRKNEKVDYYEGYKGFDYQYDDFETFNDGLRFKSALPIMLSSGCILSNNSESCNLKTTNRYSFHQVKLRTMESRKDVVMNSYIYNYYSIPNRFYDHQGNIHQFAGRSLKIAPIFIRVSQSYNKHFNDKYPKVVDFADVQIAAITVNADAVNTTCIMEVGNAVFNTDDNHLVNIDSVDSECSVSYEFENIDSRFDYEAEKKSLCHLDFLERLETKIIHNILKSKEDQKTIVKDAIDEYYRELPKKVTQEIKANYKQDLTYFTLYFYDRAGNLIRTVPPKGVKLASAVCPTCTTNTLKRTVTMPYTHDTKYAYNASGQLIKSQSADEIYPNRFWYNKKGQLRYSQTAKQFEEGKVSYNLYDNFARLVENGEIKFKDNLIPNNEPNLKEKIKNLILDKRVPSNPINRIDINFPVNNSDLSAVDAEYSFRMLTNYSNMTSIPGFPGFKAIQPVRQNLRNRVNFVIRDEDGNITTTFDQVKTYYSYDLHGNVEYVVQDLPVSTDNNGFRLFANTQYKYDLLTKKVIGVAYNYYESDSYEQSYTYDANNRLTKVNSSRYNELKDRESEYKYYNHGPLKRVELGEDKLQGIDYTYTINGWLKAINHTTVSATNLDPGRDGNSNSKYGEDAFSSILNYFKGDFVNSYSDFNNTSLFASPTPAFAENFDGNIAIWQSNSMMYNGSTYTYDNFHQGFKYDAINRLKHSNRYTTTTPSSTVSNYKTTYNYDANGNISNLGRYDATGAQFDNMSYSYSSGASNNKLTHIDDGVIASPYAGDLEDQNPNNYTYDASGNLIGDASEGLSNVKWTPDGKIKSMTKTALAGTPPLPVTNNIEYTYDAMGQRVMKMVTTMGQTPNTKQTIYARDANGQVMAIYEREFNPSLDNNPHGKLKFKLKLEWYVHGCVGEIELIEGVNFIIDSVTNTIIITANINGTLPAPCDNYNFVLTQGTTIMLDPPYNEREAQWGWGGYRQHNRSNSYGTNQPRALTLLMNGQPATVQITQMNTKMSYSNPEFLPKIAEWHVYGNEQQGRFLTKYPEELTPTYYGVAVTDDVTDGKFKRQLGKKSYELKDHLGNVRVTHSDIKMPTGTPAQPFRVDLLSKSEYYPYGMKINDLSYNATGARYGYNGTHEQDKELNEEGNYLDFGNFGFDTRVAMRRNQEPLRAKYPHLSTYSIFNNNPIAFADPDGNYSITQHYNITFNTLFKLGFDNRIARKIAHLSSIFADHPSNRALLGNNIFSLSNHSYVRGINYDKTKNSQNESHSKYHTMMSDIEASNGMTKKEAVTRGLQLGWQLILKQSEGLDYEEFAIGLHALQDAYAHEGCQSNEHLGYFNFKELFLSPRAHMPFYGQKFVDKNKKSAMFFYNDLFGKTDQAESITKTAGIILQLIQGNTANVTIGMELNLRGMSKEQFDLTNNIFNNSGFNIKVTDDKKYIVEKKNE